MNINFCIMLKSLKMNVTVKQKTSGDFVYYESRNRELKTRPIYACRCDERLKTKSEKSTLWNKKTRVASNNRSLRRKDRKHRGYKDVARRTRACLRVVAFASLRSQ